MKFRLTQKLAKRIGESWPLGHLVVHEDPLADWTSHFFIANRARYILVCNTATLYSCLFHAAGINSDERFVKAALRSIRDAMEDEGLEEVYLNRLVPFTGCIRFGKTLNRSVTGSVTEQVNAAKFFLMDSGLAPDQVAGNLNENLLAYLGKSKGDYGAPREEFRKLCSESRYANESQRHSNVLKFERPKSQ